MKIFKTGIKKAKEKKKPQVYLENKRMLAVDEKGDRVAVLIDFENCTFTGLAKKVLESEGYSTDWAKWDDEGRMVKLLENFE